MLMKERRKNNLYYNVPRGFEKVKSPGQTDCPRARLPMSPKTSIFSGWYINISILIVFVLPHKIRGCYDPASIRFSSRPEYFGYCSFMCSSCHGFFPDFSQQPVFEISRLSRRSESFTRMTLPNGFAWWNRGESYAFSPTILPSLPRRCFSISATVSSPAGKWVFSALRSTPGTRRTDIFMSIMTRTIRFVR